MMILVLAKDDVLLKELGRLGVTMDIVLKHRLEDMVQLLPRESLTVVVAELELIDSNGVDIARRIREQTSAPLLVVARPGAMRTQASTGMRVEEVLEAGADHRITPDELVGDALIPALSLAIERRLRTKRLETSPLHIEELRHVLAHDLQSRLRVAASFAALLKENAKLSEDAEVRRHLEFIESETVAARDLVLGVTELLLVESYSVVGIVDCQELLAGIASTLRDHDEATALTVAPLPVLVGDKKQLGRLFTELLHNAIRCGGGEAEVHVSASIEPTRAVFHVRDNGPGIDPSEQYSVFKPYYKLPVGSGSGSGCGLAVVRQIVESHGGRIQILSDGKGKGCTFVFDLPLARPQSLGAGEPATQS